MSCSDSNTVLPWMNKFGGSAMTQGPASWHLDKWPLWEPFKQKAKWLLRSGASNPSLSIALSDRRPREHPDEGGEFFLTIVQDLISMEEMIISVPSFELFNTVKDLFITKSKAVSHIKLFLETCKCENIKAVLYYTGHGEKGTGNWCFQDGVLSIEELLSIGPPEMPPPMIVSDTCYSGHWTNYCLTSTADCLASCSSYQVSGQSKERGSDLTGFLTGRKCLPCVEPVFSSGHVLQHPPNPGFLPIGYDQLIGGFTTNSNLLLIYQNFFHGRFHACFAEDTKFPLQRESSPVQWCWVNSESELQITLKQNIDNAYFLFSIASESSTGFGLYLLKNYATYQEFVSEKDPIMLLSLVGEKFTEGKRISQCCSFESAFCLVFSKDIKELHNRIQRCFFCNDISNCKKEIEKEYNKGKIVTGVCYNEEHNLYLIVMTKSQNHQVFYWKECNQNWQNLCQFENDKKDVGYSVSILFMDSNENSLLIMTKDDDRANYQICDINLNKV